MGVEVHEAHRPVTTRDRAQDAERDGVVAADAHRQSALGDDLAHPRLDGASVRSIAIGTTSTSPQSATRIFSNGCTLRTGFHGRISDDCSRTARGPKRAPVRYDTPPS
jgi:hypothetical protein